MASAASMALRTFSGLIVPASWEMDCPGAQAISAAAISFSGPVSPRPMSASVVGRSYLLTKGEDRFRFDRGGVGELKSRQNAESNFFAMVERMGLCQ
jgi:hypothetical protein